MQICSVEVYALLLTVYSPKFILLSAQDQVSEKELQKLSSFMAFVLASRNREMWCLAVSRVTRVNMKNNFVLIKKKSFFTKMASTLVMRGFVPSWQLGNTGSQRSGLVHKVLPILSCLPGTQMTLGYPPSSWDCAQTPEVLPLTHRPENTQSRKE